MGILDKLLRSSGSKPRLPIVGAQVLIAFSLVLGTVFAASIYLGERIELGAGVKETDACAETPTVSFGQDFVTSMSGNPSRITSINVDDIPISCAGRFFRLSLFDSSETLLESIVWELERVSSPDTSIRAVADGVTVSNRSQSAVSINYPVSEEDPLGLVLENVDPSEIESFLLESSESPLQEED